ncbi:ABC transporter ATP-binding protein [Aerosakkonemataceae cyanobacterium BLCC-F50]|uniref:ABC transporter ATP-binding protein n=1 Tax=Floridaenema flaviceps BLCC-F50 TaxID=3153642 RepID=A0ABV4XX35_9CYAN
MTSNTFLLKFARRYPVWILMTIILGFSGALFNGVSTTLIVPVLLNFLGQSIAVKGAPPLIQKLISPFSGVPVQYRLGIMALVILLAIVLKNIASYGSSLVSSSLMRKLTSDLREEGIALLLEVDLSYYSQMKVGDLLNRLGAEIGRAAGTIGTVIRIISIAITILVFTGLLIAISWQLTVATTILMSLVALVNQYSIARSRVFGKALSEMSRAYSVRVLEVLSGIRLVKSVGNEEVEYDRLHKLIRDREKADFQTQVVGAAIGPVSEVAGILVVMGIVILGRFFLSSQVQSFSAILLTYLLVLFRLLPFIGQLNNARSQLASSNASVEMAQEFLRRDNKPFMKNGEKKFEQLRQGIHFNKVTFNYPNHEKLTLKEVDLYLPRGTTLALVGGSGAGKSTLADLLPRFYDPTSGAITIDGIDLREFNLKSLRTAMGIVSQETFLFNETVRNNIAYGHPEATDQEIFEAAKRANAYEFIEKLPQGFETFIGDRGVMLSGGQRQRLAIARALLQNPDILILDEATSALDTVSERLVQQAIDELSRDRTTLVIAHRLSTIQKADQIAVLEQGRVVEVGSHEELLNKGGFYTRLYSLQFSETSDNVFDRNQEIRHQLSYDVRTKLNSLIGNLRILADNLVDTPEEQQEIITESYTSALSLLQSMERFEHSNQLPIK